MVDEEVNQIFSEEDIHERSPGMLLWRKSSVSLGHRMDNVGAFKNGDVKKIKLT